MTMAIIPGREPFRYRKDKYKLTTLMDTHNYEVEYEISESEFEDLLDGK